MKGKGYVALTEESLKIHILDLDKQDCPELAWFDKVCQCVRQSANGSFIHMSVILEIRKPKKRVVSPKLRGHSSTHLITPLNRYHQQSAYQTSITFCSPRKV